MSFAPVDAQSTNASLTGRIPDLNKAVVADAKVIVINTGTRVRHETITNQTGSYYVTNLPPGTYRIEVGSLVFSGPVNSLPTNVAVKPLGGSKYVTVVAFANANLAGFKNPATIGISLGNDTGSVTTNALVIKKRRSTNPSG